MGHHAEPWQCRIPYRFGSLCLMSEIGGLGKHMRICEMKISLWKNKGTSYLFIHELRLMLMYFNPQHLFKNINVETV